MDVNHLVSAELVFTLVVFLFSLTLHECAHAWMAAKGGDLTGAYKGRITLNPLSHVDPWGTVILPLGLALMKLPVFGWAKPVPFNALRFRHSSWLIWVSMAGPGANLLIVLVVSFGLKLWLLVSGSVGIDAFWEGYNGTPHTVPAAFCLLAWLFISINLLLTLFNLLPIPPLDGSKVFYYYFVRNNPAMVGVWNVLNQYGFIILYILFLSPQVRWVFGKIYHVPMEALLKWFGVLG